MNFILNPSTFSLSDIFIADKKRNILINGHFTKVLYSNQHIVLNSIYYNVALIAGVVSQNNERFLVYDTNIMQNTNVIRELSEIETRLLEYYKQFYNLSVNISTSIEKRLHGGKLKLYCDDSVVITPDTKIAIKISGIWETAYEIGLAIKFFPVTSVHM
jgi:hypothetical protein